MQAKKGIIGIVDDDFAVRASLKLLLKQEGYIVFEASDPTAAKALLKEQPLDMMVLDMNFSIETSGVEGLELLEHIKKVRAEMPVVLITGWGHMSLAIDGMKAGAADFINKPWDNDHLLESIRTSLQLNEHEKESTSSDRIKLNQQYDLDGVIGESEAYVNLLKTVCRVSSTDASVLILGESGTGKEVIAEVLHRNSRRKENQFVKVNLGGISSTLFESEMFGHKSGAFTDAKYDRKGRFQLADKGSIFLDEIGDLDLASQVKLLRVLQDRCFEVLGSSETIKTDFRLISATNKSLVDMVNDNSFREDLFYRINLISIRIPSLRERPEDIPHLVRFYTNNLKELYVRPDLEITKEAMEWLQDQNFPGNIRELKNLIERTVLMSPQKQLKASDFKKYQETYQHSGQKKNLPEVGVLSIEEMEVGMIKKAMKHHKGNISKVARSLGLSRNALYRRLEKYDIAHEVR